VGNVSPPASPVSLVRSDYPAGAVGVTGWAVDIPGQRLAKGVFLCLDDRVNIWTTYGRPLPGVAAALKDNRYERSDFTGQIPLTQLTPGAHRLTIKIVTHDGKSYYESRPIDLLVT
jgi:hypothetical protein